LDDPHSKPPLDPVAPAREGACELLEDLQEAVPARSRAEQTTPAQSLWARFLGIRRRVLAPRQAPNIYPFY
jgi:hypothetical protein